MNDLVGDTHRIRFHPASWRTLYDTMDVANNDSHRGKFFLSWTLETLTSVGIQGIYPTAILLLVAFKRTIWDSLSEFENQVTLPDIRFRSASGAVADTGEHHQLSDHQQPYPSVAGQVVAKEADERLSAAPSISELEVI